MKTRKDKTAPLSCRVPEELKLQIIDIANNLDMSLAQYVAILLEMGFNGKNATDFQQQLNTITTKLQEKEKEVNYLKSLTHGLQPPFSHGLATVIKNDQTLEALFLIHRDSPISRELLVSNNFKFNVLLEAQTIENKTFYFMGNFGWAFYDESKTNIIIKKRN